MEMPTCSVMAPRVPNVKRQSPTPVEWDARLGPTE